MGLLSKNLQILRFRTDVPDLLHCIDAYLLPSLWEGLSIALLEAMSYGCKIIVSDIPANKEVGLPTNHYFHCGDVPELVAKLQENVDLPYQKQKYEMTKYNWDHIASQVAEVYDSLIKKEKKKAR